jgi:hypothetical protein
MWTVVLLLVVVAIVCFFVIAVIPGAKGNNSPQQDKEEDSYDRQGYYEDLMGILQYPLLQRNSPQGQAIQWMAFEDVPLPLEDNSEVSSRLWQRFALVVWYFAHGGPNLWSSFNRDPASGWIEHGAGIHECGWKGVDCNADMQVTGLLLGAAEAGITLTGSLTTELGVLTNLEHFDVSNNRLEGTIPDDWKALTNLGTCVVGRHIAIPFLAHPPRLVMLLLQKQRDSEYILQSIYFNHPFVAGTTPQLTSIVFG